MERTDDLAGGFNYELIVREAHEHQLLDGAGKLRHVLTVGLLRRQLAWAAAHSAELQGPGSVVSTMHTVSCSEGPPL